MVLGTRPEAIKLAPVLLALDEHPHLKPCLCVTGQHRELLKPFLDVFSLKPSVSLDLMRPDQQLADFTSRALKELALHFEREKPSFLLIQGDTSTVLAASLAAFYHKIPVGHVEAGLRTGDKYSPFPEEINRAMVSRVADLHFAPTRGARENLLEEGIPSDRVIVTGNTVIDALLLAREKVRALPKDQLGLPAEVLGIPKDHEIVLITGHRRENFGKAFESICRAVASLAGRFEKVHFVYPVHLNPNVREPVFRMLSGRDNIHLLEPMSYLPFVAVMDRARVILTDSGGVQEEAPSLKKPVLVMRDTTERPEGIKAGSARLVGTDEDRIVEEVSTLLSDAEAYKAARPARNPYGDGRASGRIIDAVAEFLNP